MAKLFNDVGADLGTKLVAFGLHEEFDFGEVGDVEFSGRIDSAVAGFARVLGAFKSECGQQVRDQHLEFFGVQLKDLFEHDAMRVVGGHAWFGNQRRFSDGGEEFVLLRDGEYGQR